MRGDKVLKLAKGFRGRAKNCVRVARERVERALQYATRDRRAHKRDFRSGWVMQIGAGAREHGVSLCGVEGRGAVCVFSRRSPGPGAAAAAVASSLDLDPPLPPPLSHPRRP